MKIKLNHCEDLGDWYTIVRAEHEGKEWLEDCGDNCSRFMSSERLSPEACIEGDSSEMLDVASAIKNKGSVSFKRVAVHFKDAFFHFRSPKNSEFDVIISQEDAEEFANQVFSEINKE